MNSLQKFDRDQAELHCNKWTVRNGNQWKYFTSLFSHWGQSSSIRKKLFTIITILQWSILCTNQFKGKQHSTSLTTWLPMWQLSDHIRRSSYLPIVTYFLFNLPKSLPDIPFITDKIVNWDNRPFTNPKFIMKMPNLLMNRGSETQWRLTTELKTRYFFTPSHTCIEAKDKNITFFRHKELQVQVYNKDTQY